MSGLDFSLMIFHHFKIWSDQSIYLYNPYLYLGCYFLIFRFRNSDFNFMKIRGSIRNFSCIFKIQRTNYYTLINSAKAQCIFKGTLMQIWKPPYMFVFIWKWIPWQLHILNPNNSRDNYPRCLFTNIQKQ